MAPRSYQCYEIEKSSGGKRTIFNPSRRTKALHYAILNIVLRDLRVHPSAAAYESGRSIIKNAEVHARLTHSVRVDLSNFFPSICPNDLLERLKSVRPQMSDEEAQFLTKALFVEYRRGRVGLAVGAPSSPKISNFVMVDIDTALTGFAASRCGEYTRYADDLIFSSDVKTDLKKFVAKVEEVLANSDSPRLRINHKKTVYAFPNSHRAVTGLVITREHKITIGRHNKRYIRKLLFELGQGTLDIRHEKFLRGYLAFVRNVEPDFLNKMALRYGAALLQRARCGRTPFVMSAATGS